MEAGPGPWRKEEVCDLRTWEAVWRHLTGGGGGGESRKKTAADNLEACACVGHRLKEEVMGTRSKRARALNL